MKVAEGEYRVRGGEAGHLSKNALDHRILYTREQGYRESAEPGLRPRRYSCSNSIKCWIATSPYLLKMEHEDGAVIELKKFKEYGKLAPELPSRPGHIGL